MNVSPRQFRQAHLVDVVRQVLDETNLEPTLLDIEVTESMLMDGVEANRQLSALEAMGVHISLDDFGTGYSSLAYLRRFPIDVLKIDRAFVADVLKDEDDAVIAQAIIGLAHNLRIGVVLSRHGGALLKMLLPFRLGLGGPVGNGRQFISWISREELITVILHCLERQSLNGPVNAVSPNPVTNREFARCLGRVLSRPAVVPLPALAARLLMGEMAEALLLSSTRVMPARLLSSGYEFRSPRLDEALRRELELAE